jgi:hypothetical protein
MVRSPAGSPFRACSPVAGSLLFSSHSPLCSPVVGPSASRYRVHTHTVFINLSPSPFQIRCDPTRLLQIGDRTEFVFASATSRWISPYKKKLYPASLHPDPSRHSRPSLRCRPAESRPQKSICRLKEPPPRRHHRRDRHRHRSYTRSCPHRLQEPAEPPSRRQLSMVHLHRGKWSKRIPPIV